MITAILVFWAIGASAAELPAGSISYLIAMPDDGYRPLEELLASASSSIAIVTPTLADPVIMKSLRSARMRGMNVRVKLDKNPSGIVGGNAAIEKELISADILTAWSNPMFKHLRESAIIIDGRIVGISSGPLTEQALAKGRTFIAIFQDPRFSADTLSVFDADWARVRYNPLFANLAFSPEIARTKIREIIRNAKSSLWVYAEAIADPEIEDALGGAARHGVTVRVLTGDNTPASRPGITRLTQSGCLVRIMSAPRIFGSVVIADAKTDGAAAILGSQALTTPSFDENRELAAIIRDADRLNRLRTFFEKDWAAASK